MTPAPAAASASTGWWAAAITRRLWGKRQPETVRIAVRAVNSHEAQRLARAAAPRASQVKVTRILPPGMAERGYLAWKTAHGIDRGAA